MELTQIGQECLSLASQVRGLLDREDNEGQRARIADLVVELEQLGQDTESPIRIGVLGGFSSGKTRLMECLMGAGGRLPVSVNPSTGNITVLAFHVDDRLRETRFQGFEVEFVSRGNAREFLGHLKQKAEPLVAGAELRLQLSRLQFDDLDVWEKAKAWALETRQKEAQKYELVDLCYELHRFASAYQACGPVLQGKRVPVDEQTAMAAMVSSGDITAFRSLSVVQFPSAPTAFDPQADRLDPTRIAGLFPLIRSVWVDVQVPGPIAKRLGLDRIPRFELVDCPGLGADRSSLRDAYLCMRELKNVETIVIVVDAADPGADAPTRIYDLMHDAWEGYIKDRILAVANKFDALFDKDSSDLDQLRKLAASDGSFTEGDVRGTFAETLDEIIVSSRNVVERGRDDRIALVSALQGLSWLGEDPGYGGGGLAVYTPEFRARHLTPEQVTRWDELSDHWQSVADKLAMTLQEDEHLALWLHAFASGHGGGIERLLDMLREHVAEHGLQNLRERVEGRFLKAKKAAGELREDLDRRFAARAERAATARQAQADELDDNGPEVGPGPPNLAEAALLLAAALFDVKHQLESWRTRPFRYRPKGRTDRVDIAPELQGELNLWIADWPEWESLMDSVERNDPSLIAVRPHVPATAESPAALQVGATRDPAAPVGRSGDGGPAIDDEEGPTPEPVELQERPFPTRSEHFHARFRDTALRFEALICEKCAAGVETLLEDVADLIRGKLGPRAEDVLPALDLEANPRLAAWIDQQIREADRKHLKQALRRSVNPTNAGLRNWLVKDSLKAVHLAGDGTPDEERAREIDRLFPLPMPEAGRVGRIFAWDPEIFRRFGDDPSLGNSRHFIHVLGCLHNLVESGNLHIQRTIDRFWQELLGRLERELNGSKRQLETFARKFEQSAS
jgi:hypothetical protein